MDTQQFEVTCPKCVGLDVDKKSVVAAVCTSYPVTLTVSYKTKAFNTTKTDKHDDVKWIASQFHFGIVKASLYPFHRHLDFA